MFKKYKKKELLFGESFVKEVDLLPRSISLADYKEFLKTGNEGVVYIESEVYNIPKEADYCHETAQLELSGNLVRGIIDENFTIGNLFKENFKTVSVVDSKGNHQNYVLDEELAYKLGFLPCKNLNGFYAPTKVGSDNLKYFESIKTFGIEIRTTHHADQDNRAFRKITDIYTNTKYKTNARSRAISKLLGGLTFGVEFETSKGSLQSSFLGPAGLVPVIDGSLSSRDQFEYATTIYKGAKGLESLKRVCKRLSSQCTVDQNCSMHVHIGSLPSSKEFVISLYHLFYRLQDELFNLMPYYKRHEQAIMGKSKEYSERLIDLGLFVNGIYTSNSKESYTKEVNKWYEEIFSFVACGSKPGKDKNKQFFKENRYTPWTQQWFCPTRYYCLNLVNYFFSSGTVEIRLHGPTVNFHKTLMWLMLNIAIIRYAENNPRKILLNKEKISLKDVIHELKFNFNDMSLTEKDKAIIEVFVTGLQDYVINTTEENRKDYINAVHGSNNGRQNVNVLHQQNALRQFQKDNQIDIDWY